MQEKARENWNGARRAFQLTRPTLGHRGKSCGGEGTTGPGIYGATFWQGRDAMDTRSLKDVASTYSTDQ